MFRLLGREEVSLHPTAISIRCGSAPSAIVSTGDYRVRTRSIAIRLPIKLKRKTSGLSACQPLRFLTLFRLRSLTQFH